MEDNNEQLPDGMVRIPLDGSYGAGPDSELTIITKGENGQNKEVTYVIPYLSLNLQRIQAMCDINLIVGYRIAKGEARIPGLKELGL